MLGGRCVRQPGRTWWRRLPVSSSGTMCTTSMTRLLRTSTTAAIKPGRRSGSSCWTCSRGASWLTLVGVPSSSDDILTLYHWCIVWVVLNLISPLRSWCCGWLWCPRTGCGNGKYLHINEEVFKLGCDVCHPLLDFAWSQGHEVQMCDGLHLPYRDGCFDAVLSIAGNAYVREWNPLMLLIPHIQ